MHIKVKVHPGAGKEHLEKKGEDSFELYVKEPPQRNLANMRVVKMVADHFGVGLRDVHIVKGHRSPNKIIFIK